MTCALSDRLDCSARGCGRSCRDQPRPCEWAIKVFPFYPSRCFTRFQAAHAKHQGGSKQTCCVCSSNKVIFSPTSPASYCNSSPLSCCNSSPLSCCNSSALSCCNFPTAPLLLVLAGANALLACPASPVYTTGADDQVHPR